MMTVKQADAINLRFKDMKATIDSLKAASDTLHKQIVFLKNRSNCDSLKQVFEEMADGPTFIYNYKNSIYALDLSLYKIRLTSNGKVRLKKMTRRQIGKYFEIIKDRRDNIIDWKEEFREYDLPLLNSNKELEP